MKRKFFLLTGVAVAAAVLLLLTLGGAGRTPNVSADPYDYSWDVVLCDGAGGAERRSLRRERRQGPRQRRDVGRH